MDYVHPEALVETQWLHDHLDAPDVRIVVYDAHGIMSAARVWWT